MLSVGYVYPQLSKNPTEVVDFVGGIIRIFRGDWQGASSSMNRVISNHNIRTPLKIDALLYFGMALERSGKSGLAVMQEAYQLNPYSKTVIQYLLMSQLSELLRLSESSDINNKKRTILINRIKNLISENAYFFPEDDPWLKNLKSFFYNIQSNHIITADFR